MYKTGGNIMINFKQHMENIHPCLLEHFEYLEGLIGQRSLARIGTLNAQSEDNVYTGEMYPFLDDESSKYALIIVDGKGAKFIRFITGTHTFLNVKIVWSNNTLTIGNNPDTNLDNYALVIVGDWTDEGLGRFYEEYCKLYNKIYAIIENKTTVVLSYDLDLPQEYDMFISERVGKIATGEAHSDDDVQVTLANYGLNLIKNAYFLVFRSSDRAVIYYNNNKMGRDTTQMEYYCMDNEIGRKILINPTTRVMKIVRTNV